MTVTIIPIPDPAAERERLLIGAESMVRAGVSHGFVRMVLREKLASGDAESPAEIKKDDFDPTLMHGKKPEGDSRG